jgi:nickel-dependent lactate racemase
MILQELRTGGLNVENIQLLVATGLHKGETRSDLVERMGDALPEGIEANFHDSDNTDELSNLGRLSSGSPLYLNKAVVESDLVVIESTVEPHFFAGFTGGSKVILPGVAGTETILWNHSGKNVDDPRSRSGVVENPIRADANESLSHLKRTFAVNLVLDNQKRIVHCTTGDPIDSFNVSAEAVNAHSRVKLTARPDIVITTNGGYPLDRNMYQCVKGIAVPEDVMHAHSKIIMVSECVDGVAHQDFFDLMRSNSPDALYEKVRNSIVSERDDWEAQVLSRVLCRAPVFFVTRSELSSQVEAMHMRYASTVEQALSLTGVTGGERILVVPYGPSTVLSL